MKYVFILEENSKGIMNLYENAVKLIGPVPKQFECIYFIAMICFTFVVISLLFCPFILFRSVRK